MVEFKDVFKAYENGTKALKGISVKIEDGEFAFLVGPSGSGKSTIIKLITGEISPTDGTINVNGYNLNTIKLSKLPHLRRTLGVIFQDFRLIDKKSVYENVAFAMRAVGASNKEIRKRVPYVLELVGLDTRAKRKPQELSGGEQQRVAIARSILAKPHIIFADEPTGNLDKKAGEDTLNLLSSCAARFGQTLIIVTHDLEIAKKADRIIKIEDGKIVSNQL